MSKLKNNPLNMGANDIKKLKTNTIKPIYDIDTMTQDLSVEKKEIAEDRTPTVKAKKKNKKIAKTYRLNETTTQRLEQFTSIKKIFNNNIKKEDIVDIAINEYLDKNENKEILSRLDNIKGGNNE